MLSNNAGFLARTTLVHFERIDQGIALFFGVLVIVTAHLVSKMPRWLRVCSLQGKPRTESGKSTRN
jgi:hypothetical protein